MEFRESNVGLSGPLINHRTGHFRGEKRES